MCVFPNPEAAKAYLKAVLVGDGCEYQRWWCRATLSSDHRAWFRYSKKHSLYTNMEHLQKWTMLADTVMLKAEVGDNG